MPHLPDPNDAQAHKAARDGFYAFIKAVWGDEISRDQVLESAKRMEDAGWTHYHLSGGHQVIPLHEVMGAFEPSHDDLTWGKNRHPLHPSSGEIADGLHKHLDDKFGKQSGSKRRANYQALFAPKKQAKHDRARTAAYLFARGKVWFPPVESEVRKSEDGLPTRHNIVGAKKSDDGRGLHLQLEDAVTGASIKAFWSCFSPDRHGDVFAPDAFDSWLDKLNASDGASRPTDGVSVSMDFGLEGDYTASTLYRDGEVVSPVPSDTTAWIKRVREEWEPRKYPSDFIKLWGLGPEESAGE